MCVNESEKTTVPGDSISVELSSSELSSLVQGAIGQGAIGQGANVQGATVRGVICQGAIVRGAIVKEQLSGSNCQGATVGTPLILLMLLLMRWMEVRSRGQEVESRTVDWSFPSSSSQSDNRQ